MKPAASAVMFHDAEIPCLKASCAVPTLADVPMNSDISIMPTRMAGTPVRPVVPEVKVFAVLTERWMIDVTIPSPTI